MHPPAEHIVTFLMNYQDSKTGRNKYIDRLVRQLHLNTREELSSHHKQ
jgi:hypothetical protein